MSQVKSHGFVDVTHLTCPMTFVHAKVAMEELEVGQILEVKVNCGKALYNVPRSLKEEGHEVIDVVNNGDATYTLFVVKGEE